MHVQACGEICTCACLYESWCTMFCFISLHLNWKRGSTEPRVTEQPLGIFLIILYLLHPLHTSVSANSNRSLRLSDIGAYLCSWSKINRNVILCRVLAHLRPFGIRGSRRWTFTLSAFSPYSQIFLVAGKSSKQTTQKASMPPTGKHAIHISPYIFNIIQHTKSFPTCLVWYSEEHIKKWRCSLTCKLVRGFNMGLGWRDQVDWGWGEESSLAKLCLDWVQENNLSSTYLCICVHIVHVWMLFRGSRLFLFIYFCTAILHACVFLRSPSPQGD